MNPLHILAVILLLAVLNYANKNWRKWLYRNDVQFPVPTSRRPDLYFAYFGTIRDQVFETRGHVNMLNEVQFEPPEKAAKNILHAKLDVMLGLSPQLFDRPDDKSKFTLRPDAEARLFDFFMFLRAQDALTYVQLMTPIDEPNNTVASAEELAKSVYIIRKVADQFQELLGYKLYCIYAADKAFICQSMFDWVGFNDYDMKSHVLVGKRYKELKASLLPHQRTIIIPGGCYGQEPMPFVNFAQLNQEVAIVLCFLWLDDEWGTVGAPGISSNALRDKYVAAGKSVVGAA
mgnify:CR=1 FL=1